MQPPPLQRVTEYLANERTFLAWIRTSIAVITLGFVVAKFSLWLRELAFSLRVPMPAHSGISLPIGLAMMGLGALLAVLALWHYHAVNRALTRGEFRPDRRLVLLATLAVVTLATAMIVYLLLTSG